MARRHHRHLRRPREPSIKIAVGAIDETESRHHYHHRHHPAHPQQFDVDALLGQHAHHHHHRHRNAEDDEDALMMDTADDPMLMVDRHYGPYRRRKTHKWRSFAGLVVVDDDEDDAKAKSSRIPRQNDRFRSLLDSIQRTVRDAAEREYFCIADLFESSFIINVVNVLLVRWNGNRNQLTVSPAAVEPSDFDCVLCYRTLWKPVVTPCGHTYCLVSVFFFFGLFERISCCPPEYN